MQYALRSTYVLICPTEAATAHVKQAGRRSGMQHAFQESVAGYVDASQMVRLVERDEVMIDRAQQQPLAWERRADGKALGPIGCRIMIADMTQPFEASRSGCLAFHWYLRQAVLTYSHQHASPCTLSLNKFDGSELARQSNR